MIAMVALSGCKEREQKAPPADPPAPREWKYKFTMMPTNAGSDTMAVGNEMDWQFHRRGFCDGDVATGERFLPKQSAGAFVADVDDITVSIAVHRGSGEVIASGCAHAKLFGTRVTEIRVPLRAAQ